MQNTVIVYIGDADARHVDAHRSVREFESNTLAIAFMWGMAHAQHKEMVWKRNGKGYADNYRMRSLPITPRYREQALAFAAQSDAIYESNLANAPVCELDVRIAVLPSGLLSVYSRAAKAEFVCSSFAAIDKLKEDFRQVMMAEVGHNAPQVRLALSVGAPA